MRTDYANLIEAVLVKKRELDEVIKQQDSNIESLESETNEIVTSRAWRFVCALRKVFVPREWGK